MKNLLMRYQEAIDAGEISDNAEQRQILAQFEKLAEQLQPPKKWWYWRQQACQGFYLYGSVGVGKTFIMDMFYRYLPISAKKRCHFHQFMQEVDNQLRLLQGTKNPLQVFAANLAKDVRILFFDEFMVQDVAHAMILAELLKSLFIKGVVLIATSNISPQNLYLNGPQRSRFLPAIVAICKHCQIIELHSKLDYRLDRKQTLNAYLYPINEKNKDQFASQFNLMVPEAKNNQSILIQQRYIDVIYHSEKAVWFDFNMICQVPRSQLDYLEIAARYKLVFISNLPVLTEKHTMQAVLLTLLVDVFYDQGVRLMLLAEVAIDELYVKGELISEFKRTKSRLHEMQAVDYVSRHPYSERLEP